MSAECFAIAVMLISIFVRVERKATEPVLAPHLLKNTVVVQTAFFMFIQDWRSWERAHTSRVYQLSTLSPVRASTREACRIS